MSAQEADLQATGAVAPQTKKNIGRDIFSASNTNNLYQDKFTTERMGASSGMMRSNRMGSSSGFITGNAQQRTASPNSRPAQTGNMQQAYASQANKRFN